MTKVVLASLFLHAVAHLHVMLPSMKGKIKEFKGADHGRG
jgi:hypothetical protein